MQQHIEPDSQPPVSRKVRNRGRYVFLFLVVIFFVPLITAWLMFFGVIDFRPTGVTANGDLIQPPVPIEVGSPTYVFPKQEENFLRDKWTLVYVADECEKTCKEALVRMRQVRLSLGRYVERIARVLVVKTVPVDAARLSAAFPGMDLVQDDTVTRQLLDASGDVAGSRIFLVDPLGNFAMQFDHDSEPRAMYNDIKHLLKLSRIG